MHRASKEVIDEVGEFLTRVDEYHANQFLEKAGYTYSRAWSKPRIRDLADMTRQEFACLLYLCHEYDYRALEYNG